MPRNSLSPVRGNSIGNFHDFYEAETVNRLGELCKSSKITKQAVQSSVKQIKVTYDATNSINSAIGGTKEFDVQFTDVMKSLNNVIIDVQLQGVLCIVINLNAWDKNLSNVNEKFTKVLNLVVLRVIESTATKIAGYESTYQRRLGRSVLIEVDWNHFVNHPNFSSLLAAEQSKICDTLINTHINKLIFGSDDGYTSNSCHFLPIHQTVGIL